MFLFTQEINTVRDLGIWAKAGFNYKFNKNWDAGFSQSVRTFDNAIRVERLISDLHVDYQINKNFGLRAGGRYSYDRKKNLAFTHDFRYHLDFKFKTDLTQQLKVEYRLRYQHSYQNLFTFVPNSKQKYNLRNRALISYALEKHEVYFSAEVFRAFTFNQQPYFNNLRLNLGDELKHGKNKIGYALCYQVELNEEDPLHFFFVTLEYTLRLNRE